MKRYLVFFIIFLSCLEKTPVESEKNEPNIVIENAVLSSTPGPSINCHWDIISFVIKNTGTMMAKNIKIYVNWTDSNDQITQSIYNLSGIYQSPLCDYSLAIDAIPDNSIGPGESYPFKIARSRGDNDPHITEFEISDITFD